MEDQREKVVAAVRQSLPEFASRNGIDLPEQVMDNLANWVTGTIPWLVYRRPCPANLEGIPCACTGYCSPWRSIPQEQFLEEERSDPIRIDREPLVGGTWSNVGSSGDFSIET